MTDGFLHLLFAIPFWMAMTCFGALALRAQDTTDYVTRSNRFSRADVLHAMEYSSKKLDFDWIPPSF